jgi:gluconolactonase
VYCQHGNGAVERLEKDGKRTVLASKYDGKRLNSPNDLVYKSDGVLYFTDPPFGFRKVGEDPKKELPYEGVYRLADGKLQLVYKDFKAPNGIAFTPDENIFTSMIPRLKRTGNFLLNQMEHSAMANCSSI